MVFSLVVVPVISTVLGICPSDEPSQASVLRASIPLKLGIRKDQFLLGDGAGSKGWHNLDRARPICGRNTLKRELDLLLTTC